MGRENMTALEKVIFMADYIEPSREFEGIEEIRELAYKDIDTAIVKAIDSTLKYLIETNKKIYYKTVFTRNFYLKQ
jgi:HD superfamily phosphohydrolase YqeK